MYFSISLLLFFALNISLLLFQVWGSEKLDKAEDAIIENRWDMEAWSLLIREAQNRFINDVRQFFEKLISIFPTSGRYWKMYIEMEVIATE